MKDFSSWGVKIRKYPEYNYHAVWSNLKTLRLGIGQAKELPPEKSEFYDISLGTKCNKCCPFCYVGATKDGVFYKDVVKKAKLFFGSMDQNQKPYQCAIGSESEGTIHPEFLEFIKTLYELGIVPNYTTNGITLVSPGNEKLLEYTEKYCGGVAISVDWGEDTWERAVEILQTKDVFINLHIIIKNEESVISFLNTYAKYKDLIHTFVLLPLMPEGRSRESYTKSAFDLLVNKWSEIDKPEKVAFGANFYKELQGQDKIPVYLYEPESFSKNLILSDPIRITPSSFNRETTLYEYKI
jgi:MoaA/NifB/PqqE/SkfB family radical SAM enzyme